MPRPQKHSIVIDQDDSDSPPSKQQKNGTGSAQLGSSGLGGSRVYQTRPASSVPSHIPNSQSFGDADAHEAEPIDLTQEDDGPERELYGTLGECRPSSSIVRVIHGFVGLMPVQKTKSSASGSTTAMLLPASLSSVAESQTTRQVAII